MMKKNKWKYIFILIVLLIVKPVFVQAYQDTGTSIDQSNEINKLYEYITNMKTDYEIINSIDAKTYVENYMKNGESGITFKDMIKYLSRYITKEIREVLNLICILIIISIMSALLNNLQEAFSNGNVTNIAYFACYSLIIIVLVKSFYIGVELAKGTIIALTDFMAALMPVLMMLLASVGGFTQAALMDPIILGVTNISARIFVDFIIPITIMSFVLVFVNNMSKDFKVSRLCKLLNKIILWTQGIVMTVFVGVISVRGIASKTIDQVTMKTTKFAVDNFVPIVGKCLSDAISTVAGYSLLLKSAIGGLGLVIIIIIVLFPIVKLGIMALLYKLAAALIEPMSDERIVKCIDSAGDSLILITSCVVCVSVMCFIMIAIVASTGHAVIYG